MNSQCAFLGCHGLEDDEIRESFATVFIKFSIDQNFPSGLLDPLNKLLRVDFETVSLFLKLLLENNVYYHHSLQLMSENVRSLCSKYQTARKCKDEGQKKLLSEALDETMSVLRQWQTYAMEKSDSIKFDDIIRVIQENLVSILDINEERSSYWAIRDLMNIATDLPYKRVHTINILKYVFNKIISCKECFLWSALDFNKLSETIALDWSKSTINRLVHETSFIELLQKYTRYIDLNWRNLEGYWRIMELVASYNFGVVGTIYNTVLENQLPKRVPELSKLVNDIIFINNGKLLSCIVGDPHFSKQHEEMLFAACYMSSMCTDVVRQIISFIDIRYDNKLSKPLAEHKNEYLMCLKTIQKGINKYDKHVSKETEEALKLVNNQATESD